MTGPQVSLRELLDASQAFRVAEGWDGLTRGDALEAARLWAMRRDGEALALLARAGMLAALALIHGPAESDWIDVVGGPAVALVPKTTSPARIMDALAGLENPSTTVRAMLEETAAPAPVDRHADPTVQHAREEALRAFVEDRRQRGEALPRSSAAFHEALKKAEPAFNIADSTFKTFWRTQQIIKLR